MRALTIFLIVFIASTTTLGYTQTVRQTPPSPQKFKQIEAAVWQYFKSQPDYQPWMLITKEQVEPLLKGLPRIGFTPSDPKSILEKLPSKDEFLVTQLYTPAGIKFMERIAKYPDGYDRLDRLSRIPRGKQTIIDLIKEPGGEKMIQYMATTQGGKELGKMLSKDPNGANFNQPTGRIYTVQMLLNEFKTQYDKANKK
jgi:hypothetical protein